MPYSINIIELVFFECHMNTRVTTWGVHINRLSCGGSKFGQGFGQYKNAAVTTFFAKVTRSQQTLVLLLLNLVLPECHQDYIGYIGSTPVWFTP